MLTAQQVLGFPMSSTPRPDGVWGLNPFQAMIAPVISVPRAPPGIENFDIHAGTWRSPRSKIRGAKRTSAEPALHNTA
jgi:hypothetical protein